MPRRPTVSTSKRRQIHSGSTRMRAFFFLSHLDLDHLPAKLAWAIGHLRQHEAPAPGGPASPSSQERPRRRVRNCAQSLVADTPCAVRELCAMLSSPRPTAIETSTSEYTLAPFLEAIARFRAFSSAVHRLSEPRPGDSLETDERHAFRAWHQAWHLPSIPSQRSAHARL